MKRQIEAGRAAIAHDMPASARPLRETIPVDHLAPLMAGARARGIADAYEMMGLGVVLLNESGRVLHASARACAMLQGEISIVSEHLVGATAQDNEAIAQTIADALGNGPCNGEIMIAGAARRIAVRAVRVPPAPEQAVQLLKAVIVISEI